MQVEVKQLAECPEHLETVGSWIYEQWWRRPGNTVEVVLRLLREHVAQDKVPFTVIALVDGSPVGSCCVVENDCAFRPQYAPWVAAVYVKPGLRRQGVASSLLQEVVAIAKRAQVVGLYIDCHVGTVPVYERSGWTILERNVGDPDSVVLYRPNDLHMPMD
jgi:GNAT superfamily N-acetyltransferase